MSTVVMICKWSDDSACRVVHDVRLYSVLYTMVISGEDVCCSLDVWHSGWCVCVMWSELLLTSAIRCPLWSSVYECHKVECAFTSPVRTECGMPEMRCMQRYMYVSALLDGVITPVYLTPPYTPYASFYTHPPL